MNDSRPLSKIGLLATAIWLCIVLAALGFTFWAPLWASNTHYSYGLWRKCAGDARLPWSEHCAPYREDRNGYIKGLPKDEADIEMFIYTTRLCLSFALALISLSIALLLFCLLRARDWVAVLACSCLVFAAMLCATGVCIWNQYTSLPGKNPDGNALRHGAAFHVACVCCASLLLTGFGYSLLHCYGACYITQDRQIPGEAEVKQENVGAIEGVAVKA